MRGNNEEPNSLFSYIDIEDRIPKAHPLRRIRRIALAALKQIDGEIGTRYSNTGRPSVPPEQLILASLLQVLYGIRSERQLMEQMDYNLLFRWFVGIGSDGKVWTPESFSTNRLRLFDSGTAGGFFEAVVAQARRENLISEEHFSVDGTVIKAWASHKSFRPKDEDGNGPRDPHNHGIDFRGEKRSNATHASRTDPDARLFRKSNSAESALSYMGHALMENRNGLVVGCKVTHADGTSERTAALELLSRLKRGPKSITLGADKGYDANEFLADLVARNVTPHVALRGDKRHGDAVFEAAREPGYAVSLRKRKLIEQGFGWLKSAAFLRQVKVRGMERVRGTVTMAMAVYNIVRLSGMGFAQ